MKKIKCPGLGFFAAALSLILATVSLILYLSTYSVGGYTVNRWALTCTVLGIWLLVMLLGNMLLCGDRPFWMNILYAAAAFLLVYGMLMFIQPCISPIGFVFGSGDLNMGDTALNKIVAYRSIATAACYLVSAVLVAVAAFLPAQWGAGKAQKNKVDGEAQK